MERDHQPMLPHEILLRIAHYIENGTDFMNWIKALKEIQYPTMGDLGLILDLQEMTKLDSDDMWPCLKMAAVNPSEEIALMIANVCQFFKEIDFIMYDYGLGLGSELGLGIELVYAWQPVYISKAITSLKPCVSAGIWWPKNDVPLITPSECKITEFVIALRIDRDDESEVDDEESAETLSLKYGSLCEDLKKFQGLVKLNLYELPPAFIDTFLHQMHLFGILELVIDNVYQRNRFSITNLASALSLKKLNYLRLGQFALNLQEMELLSQTFGPSQLKELILFDLDISLEELEPVIRSLTDGLVNSVLEIVELEEWVGLDGLDVLGFDGEKFQYLMENLCNMKSLKKLEITGPTFYTSDIPFYVNCALKTTADIFLTFEDRRVNLQDLVREHRQ